MGAEGARADQLRACSQNPDDCLETEWQSCCYRDVKQSKFGYLGFADRHIVGYKRKEGTKNN
jgi:hypothetical protein